MEDLLYVKKFHTLVFLWINLEQLYARKIGNNKMFSIKQLLALNTDET